MNESSHYRAALLVAVISQVVTALFMALTPVIFTVILVQGGFGTAPIHGRGGAVIGHVNNVLAALVFCSIWLAINASIFSTLRKAAAKIRQARDAG